MPTISSPLSSTLARLLVFLSACFVLSTPPPTHAQPADTDLPYIIYWEGSHYRLERLDGTESRSIGEDYFPPELNSAIAARFSPSGEWLLAEARRFRPDDLSYLPENRLLLTNLRTGDRAELPPDPFISASYTWHPSDDLLLLETVLSQGGNEPYTSTGERVVRILDPANNRTVAEWRFAYDDGTIPLLSQMGFVRNNAYFVYSFVPPDPTSPNDNRVRRLVFNSEAVLVDQTYVAASFDVSSAGILMRIEPEQVAFEYLPGVQSGVPGPNVAVPRNPDTTLAHRFTPDGRGVLLEQNGRVRYLDLTPLMQPTGNFSVLEVDNNSLLYTFDDNFYLPGVQYPPELTWSGSSNFALLTDMDAQQAYIFDRRDGSVTPFPTGVSGRVIQWQRDVALLVDGLGDDVYRLTAFDVATGASRSAETTFSHFGTVPVLMADGQTVIVHAGDVQLIDLATGETRRQPTDPRTNPDSAGGELYPHPTRPYFLLQAPAPSEASTQPRWLSVRSLDANTARELAQSEPAFAGRGRPAVWWVP